MVFTQKNTMNWWISGLRRVEKMILALGSSYTECGLKKKTATRQ
jgi:hypothetical protein